MLASGLRDPVGVAFDPDGRPSGRRVGCGPGGPAGRLGDRNRGRRPCSGRRASSWPTAGSTSSTPAPRKCSRSASTAMSAAPSPPACRSARRPECEPKPLKGMPPFSGPQGPFAGITAGPDGTLYVSADGDGSVLALRGRTRDSRRRPTTATCRWRAPCARRSSTGCTRWVRSCPPNTNCASGSRSAATRFARRCAGCATTTWSRRGRARAPWSCPRPATNSYAQDVMSINDLLAFAAGARSTIESNAMVTIDDDLAASAPAWPSATEWLAVRGYRQADGTRAPVCRTEYYINRAFAAVGRLLQRHTGPIFPLIEDLFGVSVVEVHQEIAAVLPPRSWPTRSRSRRAAPRSRCTAHTRPPTARSPRSRSTPIPRRGSATR